MERLCWEDEIGAGAGLPPPALPPGRSPALPKRHIWSCSGEDPDFLGNGRNDIIVQKETQSFLASSCLEVDLDAFRGVRSCFSMYSGSVQICTGTAFIVLEILRASLKPVHHCLAIADRWLCGFGRCILFYRNSVLEIRRAKSNADHSGPAHLCCLVYRDRRVMTLPCPEGRRLEVLCSGEVFTRPHSSRR
jgi:hypothetical protein